MQPFMPVTYRIKGLNVDLSGLNRKQQEELLRNKETLKCQASRDSLRQNAPTRSVPIQEFQNRKDHWLSVKNLNIPEGKNKK